MPQFYFGLKQNIGGAAIPTVKAGDTVCRGQLIAAKPQGLGVNLHTSVSGVIKEVTPAGITIEENGTDFSVYEKLTGSTPWALVEEAGLVGLGGAGFPTAEKLKADLGTQGTVIINAAECEPILGHNILRIEEDSAKMLDALQTVMTLTNAAAGVIALKKKHTAAVHALQAANTGRSFKISLLDDMYPMGEERAIIREVMHTLLPINALPSAVNAVVINAETAWRVHEAVTLKKPLLDKDLTVAGKLKENAAACILKDVPLGTSVADVCAMAGGLGDSYGELLMGGPFTGRRTTLTEAIQKTTGGLIAAECFPKGPAELGLLVCACGAAEERMHELAESLGSHVCGVAYCKQAKKNGNAYKCENPGHCPGQIQKVLELKKQGAEALLIGNCTDCSNTVMSCAPKLGLPVYHITDQPLRAVNHPLVRRIHAE